MVGMSIIEWLKSHWRTALGVLALMEPVWKFGRMLLNALGDIDFIVLRTNDPGWIGVMMEYIFGIYGVLSPLILVAGIFFIVWDIRKHRPLVQKKSNVPSRSAFFQASLTQTNPPDFKPENVFVSRMFVEVDRSQTEGIVFFSIYGFNGSGNGVRFMNPTGRVSLEISQDGRGAGAEMMPSPPCYLDDVEIENIKPGEEFFIRLEQRISKSIASMLKTIDVGKSYHFDFTTLNIPIQSIRWKNTGSLNLWDGVAVAKDPDRLHYGRISNMRIKEQISIRDIKGGQPTKAT